MNEDLNQKLTSKFSDAVSTGKHGTPVIESMKLLTIAKFLKEDEGFALLSDLCTVDNLGAHPRFEVVYTLTNIDAPARFTFKVQVPGDPPTMPSVTSIWPGANWHEREAFDMFGICFDGHPDLTRILMPDEWEGHPLRKDYAVGKIPVEFKRLSPG